MKKYILSFLSFYLLSCTTFQKEMQQSGTNEIAIKNAVIDFSNTSILFNKDKSFTIRCKEVKEGYFGVSILGTINKVYYYTESDENFLPNKCIEYKGKLFYWRDYNSPQDNKVVEKLHSYQLIDSVPSFAATTGIIDDGKKGIDYFFCKNNFLKYKKVKTSIGLGYYKAPELKCD